MSDLYTYSGPGLPDRLFVKGSTPITKEEIRVITLSKARLEPGLLIWDIGSGTGSIAIEAARMAPDSEIWAVEKQSLSCTIIKENCKQFKIDGIHIVEGKAPQALTDLPRPNRVFIGGSGSLIKPILKEVRNNLLPGGRVVVNSVTLDTLTETLKFFSVGWKTEVIQVSVNKLSDLGSSRILKAANPVFIVSAWGWGENSEG